ncbi:MAG: PadR family transcriptional regulator [Candidatus Zixiibacteriota bacterium]
MPRANKTEFAVLGLLSLDQMSGYDMKAFISQSIGYFWQESYGQIYPALRKLLKQGFISRRVKAQRGRPDRHVYRLTQKGRKRLTEWLTSETEPEPVRVELLLKLFFGSVVDTSDQVRQLETLLRQQKERLKTFRHVEKRVLSPHQDEPLYPHWLATLRYGMHVTRARAKWCQETLAMLRKKVDE